MNAGIAGIVRVLHPILLGCCYDFEFDVRNFFGLLYIWNTTSLQQEGNHTAYAISSQLVVALIITRPSTK